MIERDAPTDDELAHATPRTLWRLLVAAARSILRDRTSGVLVAVVVLLMLWGNQGSVNLLSLLWRGWTGPGSAGNPDRARILPGIPWDQEWISFGIGAFLLVVVPAILIKAVFHERLADYGLGFPSKDRRALTAWSALALLIVGAPGIWFGAHQPQIAATYPLFRAFGSDAQFWTYEAGYLVFFVASEFVFRGFLLFGVDRARADRATFSFSPVFVAMLAHTTWHLGKPVPELWSTIAWSLTAGTIALATRSIWHIIVVHWVLNVFMDLIIWKGW